MSHRSEWQLVKIDFRSIFNRRCTEADYQTWHLHNQVCVASSAKGGKKGQFLSYLVLTLKIIIDNKHASLDAPQITKNFFLMTIINKGNIIAAHCEELMLIIHHYHQRC